VRERGAEIALWRIIRARGLQPQGADVELLKMAHDDALKWLEKIMMGKIRPQASAAQQDFGPKYSSGNAATPTCFQTRMSDDFGDF